MKQTIGMAALMGVLAAGWGAVPVLAAGPCIPSGGPMIDWDADSFAYETNYTPATYNSAVGSQLTVVGIVALFCSPFADLNPNDPNKEYTFIFKNLVSQGTTTHPDGPRTHYLTNYTGGTFEFYEGSPRNAPKATTPMPPNPPNADVPSKFTDGTLILSGTLSGFNTFITVEPPSPPRGNFSFNYEFAGGSLFGRVRNTGVGFGQGLWYVTSLPAGYSAHSNGDMKNPPTVVSSGTWGAIKSMYR